MTRTLSEVGELREEYRRGIRIVGETPNGEYCAVELRRPLHASLGRGVPPEASNQNVVEEIPPKSSIEKVVEGVWSGQRDPQYFVYIRRTTLVISIEWATLLCDILVCIFCFCFKI